jgi:hypothetical protein
MPLCKRIRLAIPKMEKIWKCSSLSKVRDESLNQALHFEVHAARDILEGQLTLDDMGDLEAIVCHQQCLVHDFTLDSEH